jgi:REP element-mobilizing transposase RayT
MHDDEPLAFFITWTIYGTHLQGHWRGWRRRRHGYQPPQPRLEAWHAQRLTHRVLLLTADQRQAVEQQCQAHCDHRGWKLWAVNARTTHVHCVVTAAGYNGKTVRDQLKANATGALRKQWPGFRDRPVWSVGGDWVCINGEEDLEAACCYVRDAQD